MIHLNLEQLKSIGKEDLKKQKIFYLILGVLFALAGVICFVSPIISSVIITVFMAWLFILGGIFLIITTLYFKNIQSIWSILLGVLLGLSYIFLGYVFIKDPAIAIASMAFFIGAFFLAAGIIRIMIAVSNKGYPNIGLFLFTGIIELVLALILISGWPNNSIALISTFLGIQFIFNSVDYFSISSYIKKIIN
ncbi:MAG: DUF308 domain-containing protein [Sebaldella sp.]|nr:DUF308 domain-containing protein [Sebaldella sp.]